MREDQSDIFTSQNHELMLGEAKGKSGTIVSCSGSSIDDSNRLWMLEAEVAALQKDLDHERSVRRLEARRVESMEKRWKSQMEFLVAEEMESRQLLEEMNRRNEADLEIAQNARREAVERCTQAEKKVASLLMEHSSNEEGALLIERSKRRILETKCATLQKEVESLQTIIKESSQASSTTEFIHTDGSLDHNVQKKRKLSTDVSLADKNPSDDATALRKERDELKVQLAQTQRSNRQWIRKANDTSKRANEALHYQQTAQRTQEKLEASQKERDQLVLKTQEYSLVQDQWAGFAQALRAHSQDLMDKESINSQNIDQPKSNITPPEISSVLRYIQSLKDKNQNLLTLLDSTKVKSQSSLQHITNLERTVQRNQLANETLEAENKTINQTLKETEDQLKTIKAQESIWKKEASSMRTLLDTYEHMEKNLTSSNKSSSTLNKISSSTDVKTSASTASLQLSLDSTKEELQLLVERNQKVLEEKDAMAKQASADKEEHERVLSKFEKLKKALFAEREKAQKAEERALEAETLAGKGSYNCETTKVLHLQTNPLTTAIHQKYKLEIAQLETTIEGLQNQQQPSSSSNSSTTPPSSSVNASKLHQRLKKQFREQIASYREGVYLLTGYKIEMQMEQTQPIFKVRSMFSDQEEDHLLFSWTERDGDGKLDILSTDMAKIFFREPSFEYVTKFNSVPAFLASVNLSLFEKQTFVS